MPLMRRRPLLRAAAVGGGAYVAGKHAANNRQREAGQEQRIGELENQSSHSRSGGPAAAPPEGISQTTLAQLKQLGELHEQGVLTDEEFAEAEAALPRRHLERTDTAQIGTSTLRPPSPSAASSAATVPAPDPAAAAPHLQQDRRAQALLRRERHRACRPQRSAATSAAAGRRPAAPRPRSTFEQHARQLDPVHPGHAHVHDHELG